MNTVKMHEVHCRRQNLQLPVVYFTFIQLLIVALFVTTTHAQSISINTTGTAANTSALLDVGNGNATTGGDTQGLLIPRVALTSTADATTISNPAKSLLIYNTATAGTSPTNVIPGYYYNAGSSGSPNWVLFQASNSSSSGTGGHYIGERFGGGIVFALFSMGGVQHGLIVSETNISTSQNWSNIGGTAIGAGAQSAYDGATNTPAIIAQTGHTTSAALICTQYNGGGFTDWYLPAIDELNLMYEARHDINEALNVNSLGGLLNLGAEYWSSTEVNASNAYKKNFSSGNPTSEGKGGNFKYVRAVRAF